MIKEEYVIGVDHGTGGCKITCINKQGQLVAESFTGYASHYKFPKWVEQDPNDWINATIIGIKKATQNFTEQQKQNIKAISFSAPHHVAVLLDENGNLIRKAIMWNDQRSGDEANYLNTNYGELIFKKTNNTPSPTWTLPQFLWLMKHEPENYSRIKKILFEKDYIRYKFSGKIATDYIEAEGSMLFNIHTKEWDEEILNLIQLNKSLFPNIGLPTDISGHLLEEMANKMMLPTGIEIVIGTADTAAEMYGCGAIEEGTGLVKLATAGNFSLLTSQLHDNPNLTGYDSVINGLYYQNSATNFAAASFRWFKETFYPEATETIGEEGIYSYIDKEAESTSVGSEGLLFHPYLNGERSPYWDPNLKGSFFGITTRHKRKHFARAVLEGVAFSIKDASLELKGSEITKLKIIGGGSKSDLWKQIVADVLNVQLEVPKLNDASFGGALLAATAIGWFDNVNNAVLSSQSVIEVINPIPSNVTVYSNLFDIYKEYQISTKKLSHKLSELNI